MKHWMRLLSLLLLAIVTSAASAQSVAKVGTTEYATIEEAIAAWGPGKTLTLLSNVTTTSTVTVEVNATKSTQNWTLDLGDYTWTASGCNAIHLFAAGGQEINHNYGLKINANLSGGINASGKYAVYYTNKGSVSGSTKGYRPRLEINGGTYNASYVVYYGTSAYSSTANGVSVFINKSSDGTEPIFNGKLGLSKCHVTVNAGYFNGTQFTVYRVSSTVDPCIYGGHFKTYSAFPVPGNNKGIVFGNYKVFVRTDASIDMTNGAPATYEAKATKTLLLTADQSVAYSDYVYYEKANDAINKYSSGDIDIILSSGTTATQNKSFSSGTLTIDASAEGSEYTGNITLSSNNAKFVIKYPEGGGHYGVSVSTGGTLHVEETIENGIVTRTYSRIGTVSNPEASVGTTNYSTVFDAFYAVDGTTDNKTIVLQKDVTDAGIVTNGTATGGDGKTVATFDLNGKSIGIGSVAAGNNADYTLTIIDSSESKTGTVTNSDASLFILALTLNDYSGKYDLKIQAGTWQFDPSNVNVNGEIRNLVDEGYVAHDNGNGTWTVGEVKKVAQIVGGSKYATLQAAVDAAQALGGAQTITLLDDISGETVTIKEVANFQLTIDGKKDDSSNYTVDAVIAVDGLRGNGGSTTNGASVTLQNIAFEKTTSSDGIQASHYPHHLTIQDCTYTGSDNDKWFLNASVDGPLYGVTVKNVTVEHARLIYANMAEDAVFQNITATNDCKVGFNVKTSGTTLIENCQVTTGKYAFRDYSDAYEGTFTLKNNTFVSTTEESDEGVITNRGGAVGTAHINVESGTYTGHVKVLNGKEGVLAISGGYFSEEFPQNYIAADLVAQGKVCAPATDKEGYFTIGDPNYVAQIGETKFVSLEAAATAAQSGETILLLDDIDLSNHARSAHYDIILESVTLDLDGHTIRGFNSGVRYSGSGATIKNGTFDFVEAEAKPNYGLSIGSYNNETHSNNLTLENLTVKGGVNIDYADVILNDINIDMGASTYYALWVDEDNASAIFNSGDITASTTATAVFGVSQGGSAKVTGGKILTKGKTFRLGGSNLPVEVSGGVFDVEVPLDCLAENYISTPNTDEETKTSYPYTVRLAHYVAEIVGGAKYETLEAAIEAAEEGQTITLLENIDAEAQVEVGKQVTLDLNGKTIEYKGTSTLSSGVIMVLRGGDLTVTDSSEGATGTIKSGSKAFAAIALTKAGETSAETAKLTVNNGTLEGYYYAITGNGSRHGTDITINGGVIKGICEGDNVGIFHPQDGTLTITGGTITGASGVELRSGTLNVTGGTITATADNYSYTGNGNGTTTVGAAIAIAQHNTGKDITANITGATLSGTKLISVVDTQNNMLGNVVVTASDDYIENTVIPEDFKWVTAETEGMSTLAKKVYVAQIGDVKYETLKEAVAAATDGQTITMIADDPSLSDGTEIEINKSLTITGPTAENGEPLYTISGKSDATGTNDIFITGSGDVTISNLKIKNFGNNAATNAGHAPLYVSKNFTGNLNLTNVYISDFNRGGLFLYGGNFEVDDCYIDCANSTSGAFTKGIEIKGNATGTIKNTVICNMERSSTAYASAGIEIMGNGSVAVEDCVILSDKDGHSAVKGTYGIVSSRVGEHDPSGGTLEVKGCQFDTTNGSISVSDDDTYGPVNNYSITVDDCDFNNYISTWSATSSITINSGSFSEDVYAEAGTIIIKDGVFTNFAPDAGENGSIAISGGIFDNKVPEEYCAEGFIPTANTDPETMEDYPYTVKEGAYVAAIGDVKYETLAEAIEAATDGANTILLLADIDLGNEFVNIDKAVTINGDGHSITSAAAQAVLLTGNGDVTISNTNITATKGHGIQAGIIDGTAYSGHLTLNDGIVLTVAKRGVRVYNEDTGFGINVENSTIQSNKEDPTTTYTTGDDSMGLSLGTSDNKGYDVTITNSTIQGFSYCINSVSSGNNLNVTMTGGATYGRAAVNVWGSGNNFTLDGVDVHGINNETGPQEAFACIVENNSAQNNNYTINDCTFTAALSEAAMTTQGSSATQQMLDLRGTNATVKVLGSTTYSCNSEERGGFIYNEEVLFNNKLYFDDTTKATFADAFDEAVIADEKDTEVGLYPVTFTPEVHYYWSDGNGGYEGTYCHFTDPFDNGWLADGEFIALQKDITLSKAITSELTDGQSFNLLLGNFAITKGDYSVALNNGVSVNTDKQTDIFTAVDSEMKVVETANTEGDYAYTYTLAPRVYVAQIGNVKYESLAEAVAAVPANGSEATTITMIADETITGNAGVTIPVGKKVVLDLNGKTVTLNVTESKGSQLITNNGTLTITDSSDEQNGKLTNAASDELGVGSWPSNNYVTNIITNCGVLNMEAGNVVNTANGSICYAIDNNNTSYDATLNVKGGYLTAVGTVIRQFCNSTAKENILNISGGIITTNGSAAIWTQLPGSDASSKKKATLNISGGEIIASSHAWYDYSYGDSFEAVNYSITGGKLTGALYSYAIAGGVIDGFVSGGLFSKEVNASYLVDGYMCEPYEDDPNWYTIVPAEVYYSWYSNGVEEGEYCQFATPFDKKWLMNGEFITLLKDVTLTDDVACQLTSGTFTLTLGEFDVTGANITLNYGVSVLTDKQTDIFTAADSSKYMVKEEEVEGGYKYTCMTIEDATGEFALIDIPGDTEHPYTFTVEKQAKKVTYHREIHPNAKNNYQCWFVPIDYTITDEDVEEMDFYKIHMIAPETTDGQVESGAKILLYFEKVKAGTKLSHNRPYIIRTRGSKLVFDFVAENVTLYPIDTSVRLEMATSKNEYKFYGTYRRGTIPGGVSLLRSGLMNYVNPSTNLDGYKWYFQENKKTEYADYANKTYFIVEMDNEPTSIDEMNITEENEIEGIYTVDGKKLDHPLKGLNIIRMKDHSVKKVYIK